MILRERARLCPACEDRASPCGIGLDPVSGRNLVGVGGAGTARRCSMEITATTNQAMWKSSSISSPPCMFEVISNAPPATATPAAIAQLLDSPR